MKPQPEFQFPNPNLKTVTCQGAELLTISPQLRADGWIVEAIKVIGNSGYELRCRKPSNPPQPSHNPF